MKDHLSELVGRHAGDPSRQLWIAREYLQARILQSLQESGVFTQWAFQGGTALRFLYSLPRFSEDLDFSMVTAGDQPGFEPAIGRARTDLIAEGYSVTLKLKAEKTVAAAFLRFPGLPYELGLSPHAEQTLSVRVELDTQPPQGATLETTIVRRHILLNLHHHDRPSLLAGKLHAVLSRPWCKGRDLYDLAWYLSDREWPEPNLAYLNTALKQTGWTGPALSQGNWRSVTAERIEGLDVHTALEDVRPFLERPSDSRMVTRENLLRLLQG